MQNSFLAVCDLELHPDHEGSFRVAGQRDWTIPKITASVKRRLCKEVECNNKCDKCIITRIMEEM